MSRIKELPKSSSHLLSCTQVITSVQSVVKELLENALDSHATSVEIKLEDFGLEKIEIKDNGDGISKDDIHLVAKPHCTSKIISHLDLVKINTYGFRGEALAAICTIADLEITTKIINEEFGYTYIFDHNGNILSSKPCPCNQGTTVLVKNLFNNMPVRKQLYRTDKKKKDELKMIEDILIAFGCILPRVRFVLYHNRNLIWQKSVVDRTIDALRLALGNVADYLENCEYVDEETQIKIEVFVPKCNASPICSQISSNRSIVAINKRPVRMKNIDKLLKEYYCKSFGEGQRSRYPVCFISIQVPTTDIDINLEPNKTAVLLHNMDIIKEQLCKLLSSFYDTSANIETNNQCKNASNIISPIHTDDEITKAPDIHDSYNVNEENGSPNFHLKHLLPENGQNNKRKENLVLSKKLSRKVDFQTPSSKKIKTSSFSTPPNDIYRHINTLEAFFSSENQSSDITNAKSNDSCSNEQNVEMSNRNGRNSENSCTRNENNFFDQNCISVTAQRNSVNVGDDVLVLDSLNDTLKKNMVETSMKNSSFFCDTSELLNCSEISKDSTGGKQVENLKSNGTNKNSFVSALSIINKEKNQELHTVETNKNLTNFDERPLGVQKNKSNSDSNASSPLTTSNWSRGLHPAENIQPVAVLKPKAVGSDISSDETRSSVKQIDLEEPCVVAVIERKITPFDFFCRKHRLEVSSLNPELNNQQIAQILSEKWNRLSSEEKAIYKNMVSKDYPKNIKNKDKLGKIVGENINKIKNISSNLKKRVQKKRRIRIEKNITFDMQLLQECSLSFEKEDGESFQIISCVAPGIWICCQKNKLYLLNSYRLQEAIIYFRLLNTYEFEAEQIESSFILTSSSLGDHAMDLLLRMEVISEYGSEYISDKRLTANGFKMKILRGDGEIQFELIGMTNSMAFYGVPDLKEILYLIIEKGIDAKLSDCRPGKAILYLQGEAVRIARQSPASKKIEDIEDLLKEIDLLPFQTCLHSKPFFHELYELISIHCQ